MAKKLVRNKKGQFESVKYEPISTSKKTDKELKSEYTRLSKIANKRIAKMEKGGYVSPLIERYKNQGTTRFGLKNENITDLKTLKSKYRSLLNFLNANTSTMQGFKANIDTIARNFKLTIPNGDYAKASRQYAEMFKALDDLMALSEKGLIKNNNRYEVAGILYDYMNQGASLQTADTSDLIAYVNEQSAIIKSQRNASRRSQLIDW